MEIILIVVSCLLACSNAVFIYLYIKKKPKTKQYGELELLNDLINNNKAVLEIRRIAPGQLFLRSPRDL